MCLAGLATIGGHALFIVTVGMLAQAPISMSSTGGNFYYDAQGQVHTGVFLGSAPDLESAGRVMVPAGTACRAVQGSGRRE